MDLIRVKGSLLTFRNRQFRCTIGKGGFAVDKREGDGCTPIGTYALRECWYRPDRLDAPKTGLPVRAIGENDGWCDDPASAEYNRHVKLPYGFSHERLWRDDHAYDVIVPLGYNDDPPLAGRGSAIFMHVERDSYGPTEGCVALGLQDLLGILPELTTGTRIEIAQ